MTDERITEIAQALVDHNYSVKDAAQQLGLTTQELDEMIRNTNQLRRTCFAGKGEAPGMADLTERNQNKIQAPAEIQDREKEKFRNKLRRAGVGADMVKVSLERTELFQKHGAMLMALVNGTNIAHYMMANKALETIAARVAEDDYGDSEEGIAMRGQDHNTMVALLNYGLKQSSDLTNSQLSAAKVHKIRRELEGGGGKEKSAKPGFKPKRPIDVSSEQVPE